MFSHLKQLYLSHIEQRTRFTVVVSGGKEWSRQCAWVMSQALFAYRDEPKMPANIAWVGEKTGHDYIDCYRTDGQSMLGADYDCVVMDAWSGFNPDVLGQIAGTLKGGGLFLLLTPEFDIWPSFEDPDYLRSSALRVSPEPFTGNYIRRFIRILADTNSESFQRECESDGKISLDDLLVASETAVIAIPSLFRPVIKVAPRRPTSDQQNVVNTIMAFAQSAKDYSNVASHNKIAKEQREVLVLQADRGRGKSVALGFAIATLLAKSSTRVIVTAPLKSNVESLLAVLDDQCQAISLAERDQETGFSRVNFVALDQLILDLASSDRQISQAGSAAAVTGNAETLSGGVDLLVIDEAAAVPIAVLDQLEQAFERVVFSTTLNGYEGSGSGFLVRFIEQLHRKQRKVSLLSLSEALRWSATDLVEPYINKLLLLNSSKSNEESAKSQSPSLINNNVEYSVHKITSWMLLSSEPLLIAVFELLRDAHYQTRPSDLRYLLDVPYVHLWVATLGNGSAPGPIEQLEQGLNSTSIVAVLMACEEGGFPADQSGLVDAIRAGQRRPRGNLLSQRLCHYDNNADWCFESSLRVMRIAVSQQSRRQGVGRRLIEAMQEYAVSQGCAYWGSSFSYDPVSLAFWHSLKVSLVDVGLRLETASGARNIMLVMPLSLKLKPATQRLSQRLMRDLLCWHRPYMPELTEFDIKELTLNTNVLLATAECETAIEAMGSNQNLLAQQDQFELIRFCRGELGFDRIYPSYTRYYQSAVEAGVIAEDNALLAQVSANAPGWGRLSASLGFTGKKQLLKALKLELMRCLPD